MVNMKSFIVEVYVCDFDVVCVRLFKFFFVVDFIYIKEIIGFIELINIVVGGW